MLWTTSQPSPAHANPAQPQPFYAHGYTLGAPTTASATTGNPVHYATHPTRTPYATSMIALHLQQQHAQS